MLREKNKPIIKQPISPIWQVDVVLNLLKKDREHINFDEILKRLIFNPTFEETDYGIDIIVLLRILQKLEKDGYIYTNQSLDAGLIYAITVEGYLFQGYAKQINNLRTIHRLKLFRSWTLAIGTGLAGLYGLFEMAKWFYHHFQWTHAVRFWH